MKKHDMIHDMIYGPEMAYDMWHDTTCQISLITPQPTEAGWLYVYVVQIIVCHDTMWWCIFYMWFQFVLHPIDFPKRLLIFRRRWMKQNSVARRLNLEDMFFNNHGFLQRFNAKSKGLLHFSWTSGPRSISSSTCRVTWTEVLPNCWFVRVISWILMDATDMCEPMSASTYILHSSFEVCSTSSRFN